MSEQLIRGYWITGAIAFIGSQYSSETNDRLLSGLSKDLRSSFMQHDPAQWYPRSHHVELMRAIASAHRSETSAYEDLLAYGQRVGTEAATGPLRPFMMVSTMKLFAKRLPDLWARDHQADGAVESDIAQLDDGRLPMKITGIGAYDHVGIAMLGWIRGAMARFGRKALVVKQSGWTLKQTGPSEMQCEVSWS